MILGAAALLGLAVFGWNLFAKAIDAEAALAPGYSSFETGIRRLPNGTFEVRVLTRMPGVKARMVHWWFANFLQTTEHYKWCHPSDHVWMGWENKQPGRIVGASHLVHEYIGGDLGKLRIQFVDAEEFLERDPNAEGTFAIFARVGLLDQPLDIARMCHVVRDTQWGAEMRSRFWLGHVAAREGNETRFSIAALVGNTALARRLTVRERFAQGLLKHAIEEMGYLADLLPALYARENGEGTVAG